MKLLTFLARRFRWSPHAATLEGAEPDPDGGEEREAVVVFLHAEARDGADEAGVGRKLAKHVKWLAGKRDARTAVLHSFTHLGGESAEPELARRLLEDLAERLERVGFRVRRTPFGHVCAWDLEVHGESLAKVWKEI